MKMTYNMSTDDKFQLEWDYDVRFVETEPPVMLVTIWDTFACATFSSPSDEARLYDLTTQGQTSRLAVVKLMEELKRYAT